MSLPPITENGTSLVTGASSGIGAEIAIELARRNRNVVLVARREDRLKTLAEKLSTKYSIRADVLAADLTDPNARAKLVERLEALGLVVDILVNNAGFATLGPVNRGDRSRELSMIRTNVEAVVDLCQLFIPQMASRRKGAVLNTASTAAFQPLPGQAGYGATKAFVLSYSHGIRAELRCVGVTVTALCPGPVETEFSEAAGVPDGIDETDTLPKFMWVSAEKVAKVALDALDEDKAVVIPGAANRVGAIAATLAPKAFLAKVIAKKHPSLH